MGVSCPAVASGPLVLMALVCLVAVSSTVDVEELEEVVVVELR